MHLFSTLLVLGLVARTPLPADRPVAGTYSLSDGFDLLASITLRETGEFVFSWEGCTGPIASATGVYTADDLTVRLTPHESSFRQDIRTFSSRLLRVRWGPRDYLIPEERMLEFANAVNAGIEPRTPGFGLFYLRNAGTAPLVGGLPDLPAVWRPYLLPAPLRGRVTRVLQRETRHLRPIVVIDAGSSAGLRPGMTLFAFNPRRPSFGAYLVITSVSENTAEVRVTLQYRHIRVGDTWSSRKPTAA